MPQLMSKVTPKNLKFIGCVFKSILPFTTSLSLTHQVNYNFYFHFFVYLSLLFRDLPRPSLLISTILIPFHLLPYFFCYSLKKKIGFSDSSHKTDHSIQTHIEDFVKQGVTSLSMVLLAVPTNEVIDQNHIDTLFDTMNFLSHMKNITYILGTRAEGKTKEEKRRWAMELNTHPSLSHVVKFTKGKFVWGGMIDKDVSPETKRKWVQNLRENHGDFLKRAMEGGHIPLVDETARENENFAYFESAMKYHRNLEQMLRKIPPLLEEYR